MSDTTLHSVALNDDAFASLVSPFITQGLLTVADVYVVDRLARHVPRQAPEVLLGLAFALRAIRTGHVGVDLRRVQTRLVVESTLDDATLRERLSALPWPQDSEAWAETVAASALVSKASASNVQPFVTCDGLILTHRYWSYQERLACALEARAAQAQCPIGSVIKTDSESAHPRPDAAIDAAIDEALLKQSLERLFPVTPSPPGAPAELDLQRLGGLVAALRPLTVISGGPGTGKTFTVKKILSLLYEQWRHHHARAPRVALCAPTGKAAVRMAEAIGDGLAQLPISDEVRDWLRQLEPKTIHKLLGYQPQRPTHFRHGRELPLDAEIVVVDEASMVDLALMCKLVEAVAPQARLILLGDRNQLASVEAGSVLADITAGAGAEGIRLSADFIATLKGIDPSCAPEGPSSTSDNIPDLANSLVHFVRPYRTRAGSGLQRVAYAIAEGSPQSLDASERWLRGEAVAGEGPFEDLHHLPHQGSQLSNDGLTLCVNAYLPYLKLLLRGHVDQSRSEEAFHREVLARFGRFQVLCATRRGPLGVAGLNDAILRELQQWMAKETSTAPAHEPWGLGSQGGQHGQGRQGDWWLGRPVMVTQNVSELGRMNGDIGIVVRGSSEHPDALRVAFPSPEAERVSYLATARMPAHQTVFAMTIHKSQGSQFAHTAMVLPRHQGPLMTRELVYTGLTRASERLTILGDGAVLRQALDERIDRASGLVTRLWGA